MTTIPKKPLAVSRAKKKLPLEIDWGKGIPKDRLRYINAREEALIKANRSTTAERSHMGVKAYADDSASSKGVSRPGSGTTTGTTTTKTSTGGGAGTGQGGQSRGPSGAGQGPNSASSGSKSPSSSPSGSKSPSSSSTSTGGGSNSGASRASSPNAAAQAASNKLNGYSGAARPTTNAGTSTLGGSKTPNMAASYASQKLNATAGALKTAQNPQSIQGLINSQNASPGSPNMAAAYAAGLHKVHQAPRSASGAEGAVQRDWFNSQLGSLYNDPAINKNLPNALREGMWNQRISDATKLARDPAYTGSFGERSLAPWDDAGFRTKEQAAANAAAKTGIKRSFHNYGLAADIVTPGMPGYLSKGYKTWEDKFARANEDLASHIPDNYGVTWGGTFSRVDPAHYQVGSGPRSNAIKEYGTSVTQEGIRPDGVVGPTASYGNGAVNPFTGTSLASAAPPRATPSDKLQQAMDSWNPPKYTGIPSPASTGMLPGQPQQARPMVAGDPRVSMQPGGYPAAAPTTAASNPFGAVNPVAGGRLASLQTRMAVDDALSVSPPVPTARPPSQNMQRPSGTTVASTGPESYSPQVGPGDEVFSENPMQGSQNPMQEGENPQVKRDRQQKYASRGATIGLTLGGYVGAAIGGTIGWQMGKTPPRQRQAIAASPKALNANVQSINQLAEERGGKGNPQMQVTDAGLKDVLTNPAKVTKEPEKYTTLEQMLAALAQGVDPETGKPIT